MKVNKILGYLVLLLLSSNAFAGGGWTKKKGKSYIKVAGWWVEGREFFNGNGDESPSTIDSGLFNVNIYAEYGITNKLTAIGYIPFFSRSYQNREVDQDGIPSEQRPGGDINTFGDSEVGLKYSLYKNSKIALAVSVILGLPFGDEGSPEDVPALATGDGEFNQIIKLDLGIGLYNSSTIDVYANTYVGFNNRTEGFSEEFRGGLELGAGVLDKKLWLVGKVDVIESFENGDEIDNAGGGGTIFANNTEVVNVVSELAYYFTKKIGVSASASFPVSGTNVYAEPAFSGGLFLDLK